MTEANNGNARLMVANGQSIINITGGDINNQSGGNQTVVINADALVTVLGSEFVADGNILDLGMNESVDFLQQGDFVVSGILADGTPFQLTADINDQGILRLIQVPEPASIAIWSLLGLCLAGYAFRRRRTGSN